MWELALPIAQTLYGAFQTIQANKRLKRLRNENIEYKATPETQNILGVAASNARHGFTEAEKAAVFQNFAAQAAKSYRLGMARAGNSMSNAIAASNAIANSGNFNNFAAQDANQQRQNQQIYNNLVAQDQRRADMNTEMAYRNNVMAQQAYGQAGKQGVDNIMSGIQMGSMLPFGGIKNGVDITKMESLGTPSSIPTTDSKNLMLRRNNPYGAALRQHNLNNYINENISPYNAPDYPINAPYNSFWNQFLNPNE